MKDKKGFLTYEEALKVADHVKWYAKGVYGYEIDNKWTLVECGKVLISGVDDVRMYEKGTFWVEKDKEFFSIEFE